MHIRRYLVNGHYYLGLQTGGGLVLITYLGASGDLISMNGYGVRNDRD